MKRSLMLAAVSSLALSGAAAAETTDTVSPDKDVPETAGSETVTESSNPAPAVDSPTIDKPELGTEIAAAAGDKPEADDGSAAPERNDYPGKPAGR